MRRLDPELAEELPVWRVIGAGVATLNELETAWDLDDLARANAALDMKDDIEAAVMENIGKK